MSESGFDIEFLVCLINLFSEIVFRLQCGIDIWSMTIFEIENSKRASKIYHYKVLTKLLTKTPDL